MRISRLAGLGKSKQHERKKICRFPQQARERMVELDETPVIAEKVPNLFPEQR
jgi:hypothetical protein